MVGARRGPDGRTPYERRFGKKWRTPMIRFGGHVMWLPSGKCDSRLAPGYRCGIYLGLDDVIRQHVAGAEEGWGLAHSLRRVILGLQKNTETFNKA